MPQTTLERIMSHREIVEGPLDTPCWISTYAPNRARGGYCYIKVGGRNGRSLRVHRVAYELLVEEIQEGLDLDHLCRVTSCFRPEHLEPVTRKTNVLRSNAPSAIAIRNNTCLAGHSLDDAYQRRDGKRNCRVCERERKARARARR